MERLSVVITGAAGVIDAIRAPARRGIGTQVVKRRQDKRPEDGEAMALRRLGG